MGLTRTSFLVLALACGLPLAPAHAGDDDTAAKAQQAERLRGEARVALDALEADASIQGLRSLGRLRDELDRRRDALLVALFHPVERGKGQAKVRAAPIMARIVARRTKALASLWANSRAIELTADAQAQLKSLRRVLAQLEAAGDAAPRLRQAAGDLPTFAGRTNVRLSTYTRTPAERTGQRYDAWVMQHYNEARTADIGAEAREQVRLTNDHRVMVGATVTIKPAMPIRDGMDEQTILDVLRAATIAKRTPIRALRIDKRVVAAAAGHAKSMVEGKFFAHMTPLKVTTAAGRSPGERIRAAGYKGTAMSENLGVGSEQATGVHLMWLQSPAQHRNLLGAWSDIGVAQVERRWVQNYALGDGGPMRQQPDLKPRRGK